MWELIRANKRRSLWLMIASLLLLLTLGFVLGSVVAPNVAVPVGVDPAGGERLLLLPVGGMLGVAVAFALWGVQALVAYFQGGRILLAVSGARPIEQKDHPQLYNVVEEMTIASRLGKMPDIYVIDDMSMNAFATGRDPDHAAVAVTAGLLGRLNRDQLQGVIAHEISHIVNRDVLYMTLVGIMVGTVVILAEFFLRGMYYGRGATSSRRFRSDSKGGNQLQLILILLAVVLAILTPLLAQCIYFALSRRREYLADASAAVFTRYPEGLASALEALAQDTARLGRASSATAPMYIVNPLHEEGKMALDRTRTHPPITERIRILRSLAGGVSYGAYQTAWSKVSKARGGLVPKSALVADQAVEPRGADRPSTVEGRSDAARGRREAGDLIRKLHGFRVIDCECGARLKLPPEYTRDTTRCLRCGRLHHLAN